MIEGANHNNSYNVGGDDYKAKILKFMNTTKQLNHNLRETKQKILS